MHHCLTILEVVRLVCEELATDHNSIAGYSALVRLAETCRLMYEPSMNSLWYGLSNIVPLLRCFPEDVWEAADPEDHFREFTLRRPLRPSDWTRFLHHSSRVRSLGTVDDHSQSYMKSQFRERDPSEEVYHALEMSKPRQSILPNLRRLNWWSRDHMQHIRIFLGPSITEISLVLSHLPTIADQSLLIALSSMPHITSFRMEMEYSHDDGVILTSRTTPILKDIITSWNCLRKLEVPSTALTTSSLMHVALLPNLEVLTAGLSQNLDYTCLTMPIFPALHTLGVICDSISTCRALLQASPLWTLHSISITTSVGHVDNAQIVESFFNFLQSRLSSEYLNSINLSNKDDADTSNNHPLDITTLNPLLSFPYISWLWINTPHPFDLDNSDLRKIAEGFPRLKSLHLGGRGWGAPSKITPMGLVPLLDRCRRLSWLSLAIDASVIDMQLDAATFVRPNTRMVYFCLQDSRLGDSQMMAAFLSDLMPNLKTVRSWSMWGRRGLQHVSQAEAETFEKRWKETALATKVYAQVRKQERLRAQIS